MRQTNGAPQQGRAPAVLQGVFQKAPKDGGDRALRQVATPCYDVLMRPAERRAAIKASRLHAPAPCAAKNSQMKQKSTGSSPLFTIGKKPLGKCAWKKA